jgi:DNA-binding SARP family transcriptional activator
MSGAYPQSASSIAVNTEGPQFLLRTLGTFELVTVGADGTLGERTLGPGKPLALLAYCASTPGKRHSRDTLAGLFWGDAPVDRLRQNVRQALWRLRRTLGDGIVSGDDAIVALGPAFTTDRAQFLEAVQRGDVAAALAAYGGAFLPGLSLGAGSDDFDDWVSGERSRLQQMLLQLVEPMVVELTVSGRHTAARAILDRLEMVAGDQPDTHRLAAAFYLASGDRPAARRAAERLELSLSELDAGEAATATALIARARREGPVTDATEPIDSRATWTMALTGREEAFAEIMRAWKRAKQGETHAVILTGVAGVGKSRVLAAVAANCTTGDARALIIRANPGERDIPYSFAAHIARALAEQPGALGVYPASAHELVALDPGLAATFRVTASHYDSDEAPRRRAAALYDLISAVTEQQPIALLLDDLHWCDPASRQVLSSMVARARELPLLVVAAARGIATDFLTHPREVRIPLLPLDLASTTAAIRSCGTWPDHPGAARFILQLAQSAAGVPQQVVERLSLAVDKRWLSWHDGTWGAADWAQAGLDVTITSPLDHRLLACTVRERELLLLLALAGTSLPAHVIQHAVGQHALGQHAVGQQAARGMSSEQVIDALAVLESKGLVISNGDSWQPSHDVILERMIALSTADERDTVHAALGEALLALEQSTSAIAALRHFLSARLDVRAAAVFTQLVARARRSHDPRHARDLAADLVGARVGSHDVDVLVRAVPWWQRSARTARRLGFAAVALLLLFGSAGTWWVTRLPPLLVGQSVVLADYVAVYGAKTPVYRLGTYRFTPPLTVRGRAARPGDADSTRMVRLRIPKGTASILMGGEARMDSSGLAIFGALRMRTTDTIVPIRFEAPGHLPVTADLPIRGQSRRQQATVRLLEGRIASQVVRGRNARITVARGAPINGVMQVQYSSDYRAASVWLAVTPSWGDPKTVGRDIVAVTTPVRENVMDVGVEYVAPDLPGRYWILLVLAAEDSGGFILSRSNWTMEQPLWGDGNDVASLPDSLIREANQTGMILTPLAFSRRWHETTFGKAATKERHCTSRPPARGVSDVVYCPGELILFGIEVIVP